MTRKRAKTERFALLLALILGFGLSTRAEAQQAMEEVPEQPAKPLAVPVRQGPKLLTPGEYGIGRYVADFSFTDLEGTQRQLHGGSDDQLTVLALTSTSCPLSKKYLPTLVELNREFALRGVRFVLVNSVATDKPTEMATAASQFEPAIAYCVDPDGQLAAHLSATSTFIAFRSACPRPDHHCNFRRCACYEYVLLSQEQSQSACVL